MNIFASIHPHAETKMEILRWENNSTPHGRALHMGGCCSIHITEEAVARKMAELLLQIANELEAQREANSNE